MPFPRPSRRLFIVFLYALGVGCLLGGSWVGHNRYQRYNERYYVPSIPASSSHLPSRVPPEKEDPWCNDARYKYNHPDSYYANEEKCHPLLESAFVDSQVHPPLPRPGYACANGTHCPIEWVTMASTCTLNLNRIAISAFRAGIPLTVLGYHKGWVGWGHRMRLFHDYLLTVPSDRLVIFTDATDVLLAPACSAADLISAYRDAEVPILFSGEVACWPNPDIAVNYTTLPGWHDWDKTHFHFLNGGLSLGTAGFRKALISKIYTHDCYDDQLLYSYAYVSEMSYFKGVNDNLELSERRSMATLEPDWISSKDFTPAPANARPMIALDDLNHVLISLFSVHLNHFTFPGEEEPRQLLSNDTSHIKKIGHGQRRGPGVAKHIGSSTQPGTGGTPCLYHQQGPKSDNRVLELLARQWGMVYDANVLSDEELKW